MSESKNIFEPIPEFDDSLKPDESFLPPESKSFDETVEEWEAKKISKADAKGYKESSKESTTPDDVPLKAKPYKVGEVNLDEYPTETAGMRTKGEGPLTRGEMNTLDRAGDDRKKIAETRKKLFH